MTRENYIEIRKKQKQKSLKQKGCFLELFYPVREKCISEEETQ